MSEHRVVEEWMGEHVETLADLLRPGLRAVCVGINPAPTSVSAGHYYQGRLGQRIFTRLREASLFDHGPGWEDDRAFAGGVGFTDIVKRPTRSADEVSDEEFVFGRPLLERKLAELGAGLVVFTFPRAAREFFGVRAGTGFVERSIAGAPVFVMPGPYESRTEVDRLLAELREWWLSPPG